MGNHEADGGRHPTPCPFCRLIASDEPLRESPGGLVVAFLDGYPLSPGHMLVTPRRHEPDLLGLTADESAELWALAVEVCREVKEEHGADGLTVGVNIGAAAGQTVAHVHLHIVPRRVGDVADPRGGIRWVLPEQAAYWDGEEA